MEFIDTHCHLDVEAFDADRDAVLAACLSHDIQKLVVPAIMAKTWNKLQQLCQQYQALFPAFGLHPMFISSHQESDLDELASMVTKYKPVAIGEIGLDYYQDNEDRDVQLNFFERQLEIAVEFDLPVILHVRKAHNDILALLKKHKVKGGFSHAFNGSEQQAKQYLELGFKLGFGGTMTYPNSRRIHQLAKSLPLEAIVLETDAPDMVVASHRGERNSPEYILESARALAELRNLPLEEIARQTSFNARQIIPEL